MTNECEAGTPTGFAAGGWEIVSSNHLENDTVPFIAMAAPADSVLRQTLISAEKRLETELASVTKELDTEEARIKQEVEEKNIFAVLPREIRDQIWRYLVKRPATIMPGYVRNITDISRWAPYISRHFRYQWEGRRQGEHDYDNDFEPPYDESYYQSDERWETITRIVTEPTSVQTEFIARGVALPFTFDIDKDDSTQIGCDVIYRGEDGGNQFPQVLNRIKLSFTPLNSSILRVNKQALAECSKILYGENSFLFNVGKNESYETENAAHQARHLVHFRKGIPGILQKGKVQQTPLELSQAITRMFTYDTYLPQFVAKDPMLQFFNRIGRQNAALLTKVKIEGCLKTIFVSPDHKGPVSMPSNPDLGFSLILPILTTVLKYSCQNLRELTLNVQDLDSLNHRWNDDINERSGKSDDEKVNEMVGKVVTSLGSLKVLHLGNYVHREDRDDERFQEKWGQSTRWIKFVQDRAMKQRKGIENEPIVEPLPEVQSPPPARPEDTDEDNHRRGSRGRVGGRGSGQRERRRGRW